MDSTRTLWVSPLERLYEVQREFDRVFAGNSNGGDSWVPAMDVVEAAEEVRCYLEVPGLAPDDIEIRVEDNVLVIAGDKKFSDSGQPENGFRSIERRYGHFERRLTLPRTIDINTVRAQHENGILLITLPKAEAAKPRRIHIEGSTQARELNK